MKMWRKVEEEFNSTSTSSVFRDWETLKRFYENRKKEIRKIKAKTIQNKMKTGGGPQVKSDMDSADELLLGIINEKTVSGINSIFDCDADKTQVVTVKDSSELLFYFNEEEQENILDTSQCSISLLNGSACQSKFDTVTNSEPIIEASHDEELVRKQSTVPTVPEILNESNKREINSDWKTPSRLQKPPDASLQYAEATDNKNKKRTLTDKSRRRPTQTVKALTSSSVAAKYNLLLDQRLTLVEKQIQQVNEEINFQRAKRKLELELLTLEVAAKKKDI